MEINYENITMKMIQISSFMASLNQRLKNYNFRKNEINRKIFYIDFKSSK